MELLRNIGMTPWTKMINQRTSHMRTQFVTYKKMSLHCCAALLIWVGSQVCSASTTLCRCAMANTVHGCPWYSTVIKMDLSPVELLTCARFPELLRGPLWLPSQAFCFLSEGLATVPSILPRNRHCLSDRHPTS